MNRVYKTIISDYKGNCFMEYIPAKSKKEVIEHWGGNGGILERNDPKDRRFGYVH